MITGNQGIDHEDTQHGRAIHEYVVIVSAYIGQPLVDHKTQPLAVVQPAIECRESGCARHQIDARPRSGTNQIARRGLPVKQRIDTGLHSVRVDARVAGQRGMRIEIDDEHAFAPFRQQPGQGHHRGGLRHAALLIGDGPHLRTHCSPSWRRPAIRSSGSISSARPALATALGMP